MSGKWASVAQLLALSPAGLVLMVRSLGKAGDDFISNGTEISDHHNLQLVPGRFCELKTAQSAANYIAHLLLIGL